MSSDHNSARLITHPDGPIQFGEVIHQPCLRWRFFQSAGGHFTRKSSTMARGCRTSF